MVTDSFREGLLKHFDALRERIVAQNGGWTVKGFIDVYQRIYTISLDTKVLSKVIELLMLPVIVDFAREHYFQVVLAQAQNHYPDISLISTVDPTQCFALDIKTTYRIGADKNNQMRVNGMTLGTFGGYFRTRERPVSSTFAYNRYLRHYVLGVVYSRVDGFDERAVYDINELEDIPSVAPDFEIFLHEKYRIASDHPGSGNTKNIGSTVYLRRLIAGTGVFAKLGVEVFDDYWLNYRTRSMAEQDGFDGPPYTDLKSYQRYKRQGSSILTTPEDALETEDSDGLNIPDELS